MRMGIREYCILFVKINHLCAVCPGQTSVAHWTSSPARTADGFHDCWSDHLRMAVSLSLCGLLQIKCTAVRSKRSGEGLFESSARYSNQRFPVHALQLAICKLQFATW